MKDIKEVPVYSTAEVLLDWFKRDSTTAIYAREKGRLNWEAEGRAYSEVFGRVDLKDGIRLALDKARDVVTAFSFPFPVPIRVSKNPASFTDGKFIHVSTEVFDEASYTPNAKLDVVLGLSAHECCHIEWTDTATYVKGIERPRKDGGKIVDQLAGWFQNVLEDERIERLLGDKYPGFSRFLEATKAYYFETKWLDNLKPVSPTLPVEESEGADEAGAFMDVFLRIIRYPKFSAEEMAFVEKHIRLFSAFKEVLTPYPTTTAQVVKKSAVLVRLFRKYFSLKDKKEKDEFAAKAVVVLSGDLDDDDLTLEASRLTADMPEDAGVDADAGVVLVISTTSSDMAPKDGTFKDGPKVTPAEKLSRYDLLELDDQVYSAASDTYFIKAPVKMGVYQRCRAEVQAAAGTFGAICKMAARDFDFTLRSQRHGRLDSTKYAEAVAGSPNIYRQQGVVSSNRIAVIGVGDLSGSMSGYPIEQTQKALVLIEQGFVGNKDVELFLYGHTGDIDHAGATEVYIYREPGYSPTGTLGSVSAMRENRDGVAILEIAKRVRKFTNLPAIMVVVADGAPCASSYYGDPAVRHVRACVTEAARKYDVIVIQVAVGGSGIPSEKMFDHWVSLTDFNNFPRQLSKIIQKVYVKAHKIDFDVVG